MEKCVDMAKLKARMVEKEIGRDDILSTCRESLISVMRGGMIQSCVFNLGEEQINFDEEYNSEEFPSRKVFNFKKWRSNY